MNTEKLGDEFRSLLMDVPIPEDFLQEMSLGLHHSTLVASSGCFIVTRKVVPTIPVHSCHHEARANRRFRKDTSI